MCRWIVERKITWKPVTSTDQIRERQFDSGSARMSCPVPAVVCIVSLKSGLTVCNQKCSVTLVYSIHVLVTRCLKVPNIVIESFDRDGPIRSPVHYKSCVIKSPQSLRGGFCCDTHCHCFAFNIVHDVDRAKWIQVINWSENCSVSQVFIDTTFTCR